MKNRSSGFTLVELMVVVLLVALLGLVATQIPLFGLSSWIKGSKRLKLQRDAHYAMTKIQGKLRPTSFSGDPSVSPDEKGVETDELRIGNDWFSVDSSSYDLVQTGDNVGTVISGDEGTEFIVERNGETIKMRLTLVREKVGTVILRTAVKPRN